MNAKKLIRNFLLLLAFGSLAYMIVKEIADRRAVSTTASASADITPATKLVVYYFSEGKECVTCEQIPLYARAVLDEYFDDELKSGAIVWCEIDVDEPRNKHYIDEYGIYAKTIVLSRIENEKQTRWKNLTKVWDVIDDRQAFIDYVRDEVRAELGTAA